jgi:hypothetical protein
MSAPPPKARWPLYRAAFTCSALAILGYTVGYATRQEPTGAFRNVLSDTDAAATASISADAAESPADESSSAPAQPWQSRWEQTLKETSTPARDRLLAKLVEELATRDPHAALALAQTQKNLRLRDELRDAALRGWASVAPDEAVSSALQVDEDQRRRAVSAVFEGAGKSPDALLRIALSACSSDRDIAGDYGHAAIATFVDSGAYEKAVEFASKAGTDAYPFLLKSAFYQWAQSQPSQALAAADASANPVQRAELREQVYAGWAKADAKGLAQYALTQGDAARRAALEVALPDWVEKDPVAATLWIQENDTGSDFDAGASAVANLQSLIHGQPAKAMEWAQSIQDPQKRTDTLRSVFRQWAEKDARAARDFVTRVQNSADRSLLVGELNDLSPTG